MSKITRYNRIIIGIIVIGTIIRQFVPIGVLILQAVIAYILLTFIKKVYSKKLSKPYKETIIPILCLVVLCFVQLATLSPQVRAVIQAWLIFIVMYSFSNWNITFISSIKSATYIIAILGTFSAIFVGGFTVLDMSTRMDMLIDKGMLTIWFSITLCVTFTNIIINGLKNKSYIIFFIILFANLFVIQSKTCIVSFIIYLFCFFVFSRKQERKRISFYMGPLLVIYIVLAISNPTQYIPHTFVVAINQIAGSDIIFVHTDKFDLSTYESRELIDAFCTKLFLDNPIYGIGLGNYGLIRILPTTNVTECENTYFDLLVNGGILYGGPVIYILFISLFRCIKKIKESLLYEEYYYILGILVSIIVSFRWNDFLNVNIFMFIGTCYFYCKNESNLSKHIKAGNL